MGCTPSKDDKKKDDRRRSEAPNEAPERKSKKPPTKPPGGGGKDKVPKPGPKSARPAPPPFSKGAAAAAATSANSLMAKSMPEAGSQSQLLKTAATAAAAAVGAPQVNPKKVNGLAIVISIIATATAAAVAETNAQKKREKRQKKEAEEQERRFAAEEREAAVLRRVEEMERRAEEATRKLEEAHQKLNKSDSTFKSISDDGSDSSKKSPQRSHLYSESPGRSPGLHEDPHTAVIELRQGLGVYTIEEELQPPGTGTRFSIKNTTDFTAVVSLSFIGSKNLEFQIPESSAARGVTHSTIKPPDGVEVCGETGPTDQLTLCIVKPANVYSQFTICVQSKWQLLADKDLEKPASNRVMISKEADAHVYSPPARSESRSPGKSRNQQSPDGSCDVSSSSKELHKLRQKEQHGDGIVGAAIKYNIPFVDPDFPPDPHIERHTQRPCSSWQRAEKVYRKANKISVNSLSQVLQPKPCSFETTGEAMRWVIMGICALLDQSPDALYSLYPCLVNPNDRSDALQKVSAVDSWWCANGWWVKQTLDSYIPVDNGLPSLVVSKEVWPSLVLKAYARSRGGFNNIKYGTIGHFLQDATGCPYKRIPFTFATEECNTGEEIEEGDSDLFNLWETIKEHLSLKHIVVVNTREHSASELTWRGDCDIEIEDSKSPPLWAFPPDTSLPILDAREDATDIRHNSVRLRNRWGWPLEINDAEVDKSDRWVSYSDLLNGFSSLTICFLSPGWNDMRVKIHAKAQLDTYFELFVTSEAQLQIWLGSATHSKSLMGLLILEPTSDNRYGNYKSKTVLGIEKSSQIWGEVTLEKAASPYLIIPLLYRDPDEFGSADVYDAIDEYILSIRSHENTKGKAVFKQSSSQLITQAELAAILQSGDSKTVAEDKSGHAVTIKVCIFFFFFFFF